MAKLAILAILWTVTLWRVPAAVKRPAKRPMWSAFAALAAALTVELPQIGPHLDAALHITNGSTLIKHLAGMLAAAAVLEWVIGSTQPTERLGAILAWRHVMTGAAMATLAVLFVFVPRIESTDFIDTAPGHPVTIVYEAVWLSYLGLAMLCAAAMFTVAWHRAAGQERLTRTSFALLAVGTALGVCYALWRIIFLAASLAGSASPEQSHTGFGISNLLQDAAIVLILAGTCVPALAKATSPVQHRRDLIALRPLWEQVTQGRPDTVLDGASNRDRDRYDPRYLRFRLIRRTVEIRDALATLYEYCDLDPAPHVEAFATSIGLTGIDHEALVEAATIRYSLTRSYSSSARYSIVKAERGGSDLRTEVDWLRAVTRALDNHPRIQMAMIPVLAARNEHMETA